MVEYIRTRQYEEQVNIFLFFKFYFIYVLFRSVLFYYNITDRLSFFINLKFCEIMPNI